MTLGEWSERLDEHFCALRADRPQTRPVFALEHGLNAGELEALQAAVRNRLREAEPTASHCLPLVVYATELGYRFDGTEYWPAFERETPGWTIYGDRNWLRRAFRYFAERYGGAKPEGRWARHFGIIAWPITHAVLPRDLQRHLVRALYDLRLILRSLTAADPEDLGDLIGAGATSASNRFLQFCQQPALVGQIALALYEEEDRATAYLSGPVLQRLVASLRNLREGALLDEARQSGRLWLRGLSPTSRRGERTGATSGDRPADPAPRQLGLEVDIEMRPRQGRAGVELWDVVLLLPGLQPLIAYRPSFRQPLETAYLNVQGSEREFPPRFLLYGRRHVVLDELPEPTRPLLDLDTDDAHLRHLLGSLSLPHARHRLFRVRSDGAAREVRGRVARPGQTYILLSADDPPDLEGAEDLSVTCEGVSAVRFSIPDPAGPQWDAALSGVDIHVAANLTFWPAGPVPAVWDGNGSVEWVEGDPAVVGLMPDAPVASVEVSLDKNSALPVEAPPPGEPVFLSLGPLRPGAHELTARAHLMDGTVAEGCLAIRVRPPSSWRPAASSVSPLQVRISPPAPAIDELWAGDVTVEVFGPPDGKVRLCAEFFDGSNQPQPFEKISYQRLSLPLSPDDWHAFTARRVLPDSQSTRAAERARSVMLRLDGGPLGAAEVHVDRRFRPLRWLREGDHARLIDDRDSTSPITVSLYRPERPAEAVEIETATALTGFTPQGSGLLLADDGTTKSVLLIVPTRLSGPDGLRALHPTCDFGHIRPVSGDLRRLLSVAELWASADRSRTGTGGQILRRRVLRQIARALTQAVSSPRWTSAEDRAAKEGSRVALNELADLIRPRSAGDAWRRMLPSPADLSREAFAGRQQRLVRMGRELDALPPPRVEDTGPGRARQPGHPLWHAEFALRLASAPHTVAAWAGDHLDLGLQHILEHPYFLRASRYIVLAASSCQQNGEDGGHDADLSLYPSWSWPSLA